MAIPISNGDTALEIERIVWRYMRGLLSKEATDKLMNILRESLKVTPGDRLLFRYPVPDPQNPTLPPRIMEYAVRCPRCRKPFVYFFQDFGPGCSGTDGGCGCKVAKEKRPGYEPPNDAQRGTAPHKK